MQHPFCNSVWGWLRVSQARHRLGALGERLAALHLEAKGYRILARNYRCRLGEIDIVAERDGCLTFVEVRTRRGQALGTPQESVTAAKQARLRALAQSYCQEHGLEGAHQRIDVVAVALSARGRLLRLEHIEGAVLDSA